MQKVETSIFHTKISDSAEGTDTGPLFQIRFLEGGGRLVCEIKLEGGQIFCL